MMDALFGRRHLYGDRDSSRCSRTDRAPPASVHARTRVIARCTEPRQYVRLAAKVCTCAPVTLP